MNSKTDNYVKNSYKMHWELNEAPHGLIDIIRGCNCRCEACYNNSKVKIEPYEKVIKNIDAMLKKRNVSTLGIIGGEPLLHPDIFKIIKYVKQKGLNVEILSNGVLIDEPMAKNLSCAGVDFIFLHIDKGQIRSDLKNNTEDEINNLRSEKAKLLAKYGIDVGMSITIDNDKIADLGGYVDYFMKNEHISTFLLSLYRDVKALGELTGDLENGIKGKYVLRNAKKEPEITDMLKYFNETYKAAPYWYLTGITDKITPRWLMYIFACAFDKKGNLSAYSDLKYSEFEKKYTDFYKRRHKKFPMFKKRKSFSNFIHVLFNGLLGGFLIKNLRFLSGSVNKKIYLKRILIQSFLDITPSGVEYCDNCPDAVIKNGKLLPNCVSDFFGDECDD